MVLCGREIDDPREIPVTKRDYREFSEGVRTKVRELWVYAYEFGDKSVCTERIPVTMTNRGVCTFGGRQVKDEAEKKTIAEIMEGFKTI